MESLVVGGNGFVGTHLVDALVDAGHAVRVLDRGPNKFRPTPAGAEYVRGNVGDGGLVREAVAGAEVVFHLTSTTLPDGSNKDPAYDVRTNLADAVGLLEACVAAGVRKVVFPSSGGTVYGPPRALPVAEDHPTDPTSSYGIVKLAVEKYLGLFRHLHGLDYAALRISNLYGPYQDPSSPQGAVAVFLHRIHAGRPITVWGAGNVVRDYLYVADVVEALLLAARTTTDQKVFNAGSARGTSLNDLISLMTRITGREPDVEYRPGRALDVPANVLDTSRIHAALGWSARTDLAVGLGHTWAWTRTLPAEAPGRTPARPS